MADWFDAQEAPEATYGGTPGFEWRGPATGEAVGPGATAGGQMPYSDAAFQEIMRRYPPTNEGVRQAYAEAQRVFGPQFGELLEHPQRLDKFRLADGRVIDAVGGAGGSNPQWAWMVEGPGHGGGGGAVGPGPGQIGSDPSFAFRMGEGQKALERSAAAKGTLLTGGTLKALTRYAQDYASTEYGNVFDRLYRTAGLGLQAAGGVNNALSSYGNNQAQAGQNYGQNVGNLQTQQGNVNAAGQVGASNAWGNTIGAVANGVMQMPWFNRRPQPPAPAPMPGAGGPADWVEYR